jgi:TolB-like protein
MTILTELKRRHVFRVAGVYAIVSWGLLQGAGALEGAMGLPDWFDGFILSVLLLGFPIALIFAWAFELTPEGVKRTPPGDDQDSSPPGKRSVLYTLLVVALLAFAITLFLLQRDATPINSESAAVPPAPLDNQVKASADPSIAVLAFDDMSPEGTEGYFADGIAEEILNLLAKTNGLKVAARTSSFAFKGQRASIGEIGKQLQVAHVLEGSVRRAGDSIRVTAQLINTDTGFHLWSETYDRELTNVFAMQDDIAKNILAALQREILGLELKTPGQNRHQAETVTAYKEFLIGKELLSQLTKEGILAGISRFEAAMEIEPGFALPYAYAAYGRLLNDTQGQSFRAGVEIDEKVPLLLEQGLMLAPDDAEVMAIQGRYLFWKYQYDEALASLNKALEVNPNFALAYAWRADALERQGMLDEMLADRETAYRLDPLSLTTASSLVGAYRNFQRYGDADRVTSTLLEIFPDNVNVHAMRLITVWVRGDYGEMTLLAEKAAQQFPDNEDTALWLNSGYLQLGLPDKATDDGRGMRRLIARATGDAAAERAILDEGTRVPDWEMHYAFLHGDEAGLAAAVDEYIEDREAKNYPWRTECDTTHALFIRMAGRESAFESIMAQCATEYEPALESGYLCYCSWVQLINYFILSGREEEAVQKLFEWFDKGGSQIDFESLEVISLLRNRPEYPRFLERNAENIARKRQHYLQGKQDGDGST